MCSSRKWSPLTRKVANDPGHSRRPDLRPYVATACAIAISDLVQSPNEPEKSSIDVLSPRFDLVTLGPGSIFVGHIFQRSCSDGF